MFPVRVRSARALSAVFRHIIRVAMEPRAQPLGEALLGATLIGIRDSHFSKSQLGTPLFDALCEQHGIKRRGYVIHDYPS